MQAKILIITLAVFGTACASPPMPDRQLEEAYKVPARKYCSETYNDLSVLGRADCMLDEYHRKLRIGEPEYYAKFYPYGHQYKTKYEKVRSEAKGKPPAPQTAKSSLGSCFFVSHDGLVVTNHHVISGKSEIKVIDNGKNTFVGTLHKSDPANDLAILRVNTRSHSYLTFSPFGTIKTGQKVFTVGYPVSSVLGTEPKFTDGAVSSTTGIQNMSNMFQMTVPIQPGNSGGPVLNEKGQVVGVATSSAAVGTFYEKTGALPQNVNWGIKSEYVSLLTGIQGSNATMETRQQAVDAAISASCMVTAS